MVTVMRKELKYIIENMLRTKHTEIFSLFFALSQQINDSEVSYVWLLSIERSGKKYWINMTYHEMNIKMYSQLLSLEKSGEKYS